MLANQLEMMIVVKVWREAETGTTDFKLFTQLFYLVWSHASPSCLAQNKGHVPASDNFTTQQRGFLAADVTLCQSWLPSIGFFKDELSCDVVYLSLISLCSVFPFTFILFILVAFVALPLFLCCLFIASSLYLRLSSNCFLLKLGVLDFASLVSLF